MMVAIEIKVSYYTSVGKGFMAVTCDNVDFVFAIEQNPIHLPGFY